MKKMCVVLLLIFACLVPQQAFPGNLTLEYECEEIDKQRMIDFMCWYFNPIWTYLKEANPTWTDDQIAKETLRQWLLEKEARYRTITDRNSISHDKDDWLIY